MLTATTKRAQIPFSAWLPAAIAAPTPVSALVHSSTLVTAGVYLLIRHREFLGLNHVGEYLIIIGRLTIIMAGGAALLERDLKKIVAFSTLSQLGVIVLSLGLGSFLARFFHLLSHAFFKALLFLGTGSIIHNNKDYQDLRIIGGRILPITHSVVLVSRLSLIGVPFISAFFSKEIILELVLIKNFRHFYYVLIVLGVLLTAAYRRRFLISVFKRPLGGGALIFRLEEDISFVQAILLLLVPATTGGFYLRRFLFVSPAAGRRGAGLKILVLVCIITGLLTRRVGTKQ